tara:strand:+ start:25 stop:555 length:531 start_codon:yes stop_codon:yes gene_type:complete
MAVVINGNGAVTGLTALPDSAMAEGSVIQVIQTSTTTQASNNTVTFQDTNLSGTITPISTSSKILIYISQQMFFTVNASGNGMGLNLLRGSTIIHNAPRNSVGPYSDFISGGNISSLNHHTYMNLHFIDSPSTTNATTYKTQFAVYEAANSANSVVQVNATPIDGKSYMTLMEVSA